MTSGGVVPVGSWRNIVCTMAVTCDCAVCMLAEGWKKTLITPTPLSDCDSMCSISFTVVVMARSEMVTMRLLISLGDRPP